MTDLIVDGEAKQAFTFQLAARSDMAVPRFHTLMLAPGTYRVSLAAVPGFTAYQYTTGPRRWITEFYAYRPYEANPNSAIVEPFVMGGRWESAEEAFAAFVPRDIIIPGDWPLPVMFCIADAQERDNSRNGLSILLERR